MVTTINGFRVIRDNSITASSPNGELGITYHADGKRIKNISGKLDAKCSDELKSRNHAGRFERTNPFDKTTWKIGYKQVDGILQQPYIFSPHGWQWWNWKNQKLKPKA